MSDFRKRLLSALGSVISVTACNPDPEAVRASLREGLEGSDYCQGEGYRTFAPLVGTTLPAGYDYLEWRAVYRPEIWPRSFSEVWAEEKASILDESLSLAETDAKLVSAFSFVLIEDSVGSCSFEDGCDRYVLPDTNGIEADPSESPMKYSHLLAIGPTGATFFAGKAGMREFLGTIDEPREALWIASLEGYRIECSGPNVGTTEGGFVVYAETGTTCDGDLLGHRLLVARDGSIEELSSAVVEKGDQGCAIGRLPSGGISATPICSPSDSRDAVGAYFAEVAQLEAASIVAFRELARDLERYGAPTSLVEWAERAAVEEARHAAICGGLARRYGVAPDPVRVEPSAPRDLRSIALDNAVEGLVREAFGALLAHHQGIAAMDVVVRAGMREIARDETGHAEFSIALHDWLRTRLSVEERAEVDAARLSMLKSLDTHVHRDYGSDVRKVAGLPSPDVSRRLFRELFSGVAVS